MKYAAPLFVLTLLASPALAQSQRFDVVLAGRTMGQIAIDQSGASGSLNTVLDNTPLGVGDGGFRATISDGAAYRSQGTSGGDGRRIDVDYSGNSVSDVRIDPPSEATDASDPGGVPAGVLDPVRGFARMAFAEGCVAQYRMYDGRRVVRVTPTAQAQTGDTLTCDYAYDVVSGPGHLSPFRFSSVRLTARYGVASGAVTGPRDVTLGAGPFTVTLIAR